MIRASCLPTASGVEGILICNYDGVALKSTLGKELTAKYSGMYHDHISILRNTNTYACATSSGLFAQLAVKTRSVVRTIDADVC